MDVKRLFSRLKEGLGHSPVVANVIFAFLMALIEKILGAAFACPCDPKWNSFFAAAFFIIPACTAFLLMMVIYRFGDRDDEDDSDKWWSCLLPPVVWQVIIFLDGQYFVCAMTDWPGKFVSVDKTYLKWCEPTNMTRSEELMDHSHRYYILSQGIGLCLLLLLTVLLLVYVIIKYMKKPDKKTKGTQRSSASSASSHLVSKQSVTT
ncbi:uncharacterized protein LOC121897057 [Thunnus maccoyii]|uniref:uncharacterized protein LOC121897057 n=1 Tax=Thunnus maccoyii TaxID=8240 RepID=UPI001C4D55E0|nr:uncharacterized protein LOC121897057 [Thunnus maccoyii]